MKTLGNLKVSQPLDKKIKQPKKAAHRNIKADLGSIVLRSAVYGNPFERKT